MRRLYLIAGLLVFFVPSTSAQPSPAARYAEWQRPFLAWMPEEKIWGAAFVSPEGQAYEYRNEAGDLLVVMARVKGECWHGGIIGGALDWSHVPCKQFERADAAFREAIREYIQRQNKKRT